MAIRVNQSIKLGTSTIGPKYLLITRIGSEEILEKLNPFLLKKCIDNVSGEIPISVKKLREGKILVHTSSLSQAEKLVTLTQLDGNTRVNVSLHPRLNKSKGVVWNRDFKYIEDEELLNALKEQGVTGIQRMKRRNPTSGEEEETGMYFLYFDTQDLPKFIMCGYEKVAVREYEADPQRCFKCLQFGHLQTACRMETKICGNCGDEAHTDWKKKERCEREKLCVNCQSDEHGSFYKKCPAFIKERTILRIGKEEKVDPGEARKMYRQRFQKSTFPSTSDHPEGKRNSGGCEKCAKLESICRAMQERIRRIESEQKKNTKDDNECKKTSGSKNQGIGSYSETKMDEDKEAYGDLSEESTEEEEEGEGSMDEVTNSINKIMARKISPTPGNESKKIKITHRD